MTEPITEQAFEQEVLRADKPVVVDFFAPWCGPCKLVAPMLEEISRERTDLKIVEVDVDQANQLAQQYHILSVPTLMLFRGGQLVARWAGLRPKPMLLKDINAALAKV